MPPHSAESLRPSGPLLNFLEAVPRISQGAASFDSKSDTAGKAEPFRKVLRQSRENKPFDNAILNSREIFTLLFVKGPYQRSSGGSSTFARAAEHAANAPADARPDATAREIVEQ